MDVKVAPKDSDLFANTKCQLEKKHIDIFGDLTKEDLCVLFQMAYMKDYSRHQQIYCQRDPGAVIYLLKKGRVKIYKLSPEGKQLTLEIREPGEIFGEMALVDDGPRDTIAEALDDTRLCVIRRQDFEMLLRKKPSLGLRLTKLIGMRRREIENQLENVIFRSASSRLALLLMSLAEKHGVRDSLGIILNVKLSQQELANLIGIARETANTTLSEFKRLGVIDIQYRRITILDEWGLKRIANANRSGVEGYWNMMMETD